jgi:hypothetical protein
VERNLFSRRWLYVGVNRGWRKGSKVLFVRKADSFVGSGIIWVVKPAEELDDSEKELCFQRNWSDKLYFATLARFAPPISITATSVASQSPITLHGSELSEEIVSEIEQLALVRIIT